MRHKSLRPTRLEQPCERPLPRRLALPSRPKLYRQSPELDGPSPNSDEDMPQDFPEDATLRSVQPDMSARQVRASFVDSVMPPERDASSRDTTLGDPSMLLQPDTRPITAEQLGNEVKGIYSGLVMVEKKCVETIAQRASTGERLSNDQWQALTALHRTLLHEHYDFFVCDCTLIQSCVVHSSNIFKLASGHHTASPALRRLAQRYDMPARLWSNGIHAFLELLRQQLPNSYDHMLDFVYLSYNMMAQLKEFVPSFQETWIERLGDLARYRMHIEEIDMEQRNIWSQTAVRWYEKAADLTPNDGRIQHHLAVLARPAVVWQLFYYSKSLISVIPFSDTRQSIMLLFSPLLNEERAAIACRRYTITESSLVTAFGILFTRGSVMVYNRYALQFSENLHTSIEMMRESWKVMGPKVAGSLIAGLLDYGNEKNWLWKTFNDNIAVVKSRRGDPTEIDLIRLEHKDAKNREIFRKELWQTVHGDSYNFVNKATPCREARPGDQFESSDEVTVHVLPLFYQTTSIVARKSPDENIVPFMNFILSFLWSLAYLPGGLAYIEAYVPWMRIITFLNTLSRAGVSEERVQSEKFPEPMDGTGRHLPEDFLMRGVIWAQYVFPVAFFRQFVTYQDERHLKLPGDQPPRAERCLWLGVRLASVSLIHP